MGMAKKITTEETRMTASSKVSRALEKDILNGRLKPGVRLDEKFLANRFKVSRTPVREAFRNLESAGLIEVRLNHGAVVKELTITELIEMFQVMAELEGLCARLSARRITAEKIQELREAHELCVASAEAGDHEGFFAANNIFHEAIYLGSHNSFLQGETRSLRNRVNPYRRVITFQPRRMVNSIVEHQSVFNAIKQGDADAADRFMREHVNLLAESASDVITALDLAAEDIAVSRLVGGGD
jgi:DNA-binding GntR family transcriptional regulator